MEASNRGPGTTALHRNPFHVLGATLDSTRQKIAQLATDRALLGEESEVQEAQTALIRPQTRLAAEVGWLPGLPPEIIQQLVQFNRFDSDVLQHVEAPPLVLANAYAAMFELRSSANSVGMMTQKELPRFLRLVDLIDVADVVTLLNRHRELAGFSPVTEGEVAAALQEQRRYYLTVCNNVLGYFGRDSQGSMLTIALTRADSDAHFVHDVVDDYKFRHAAVIDEQLAELHNVVERIGRDPSPMGAPLFQWKSRLPQYGKLVWPVLKSCEMRGLRHEGTEALVWEAREAAVGIANAHEAYETSRGILDAVRHAFAGHAAIEGIFSGDLEQIEDILRRRSSSPTPPHPAIPAPQQQEAGGRPMSDPPSSGPETDRPSMKGVCWKIVPAIFALLVLARVFIPAEDDVEGNQNGTEPSSAPITRGSCDGVSEWWDDTYERIQRSNSLINGLPINASDASRRSTQIKINAIAREQESSDPPRIAQSLNDAHVAGFKFIAADLTDMGSTEEQRDLQHGLLQANVIQKQDALAKACDFEIVEPTKTS